MCVGMRVNLHIFLTLMLGQSECSASSCDLFARLAGEQMDLRSGLDVVGDRRSVPLMGIGFHLSNT